LLLKIKSSTPGERGEYITISDAEWKAHGKEQFLRKKPTR
jgi:hypothetical protein